MDISDMSLEELRAHQREVDAAIKSIGKRKRAEALKELRAVAKKYGFALEELVGGKEASGSGPKGVAKYANPENPAETWTGRGRQPNWIKSALAAGKSLEDMAI